MENNSNKQINLKKLIYCAFIFGSSILMNSCAPVYVKEQPANVVVVRPQSPNVRFVWTEGNWRANRHHHNYYYRHGYWSKPHGNRNYVPGYWKTNKNGHRWINGHWR